MTEQRPTAPAPIIDNIPAELKARNQWVNWRFEYRGGKWTKVPYTPGTTDKARTNAPVSWRSFQVALSCYEARADFFDGIGYVFSKDDPYAGGDIDHCIDDQGSLSDFARQYLPNTYAEKSPSGRGVKFIARAKGTFGRKTSKGELYSSGRFFTITGNVLVGRDLISNCQSHIEAYADALGMEKKRATEGTPGNGTRAERAASIPADQWEAGRNILRTKEINRLLARFRASAVSRKTGKADTQLGYLLREDYKGFNERWPYVCIIRGNGSIDDSQVRAAFANNIKFRDFSFPEYTAIMHHFFGAAALAKWGTKERWREEMACLWLQARGPRAGDRTEVAKPAPPQKGRAGDHKALLDRAYETLVTYKVGISAILTTEDLAEDLGIWRRTAYALLSELSEDDRIQYRRHGPYEIIVHFSRDGIYSQNEKGDTEHSNGIEEGITRAPIIAEHSGDDFRGDGIYSENQGGGLHLPNALSSDTLDPPVIAESDESPPDTDGIYSDENSPVSPIPDAECEKADDRDAPVHIYLESSLSRTVLLPAATIPSLNRVSLEQAVAEAFENLPRDRLIDVATGERKKWPVTNQRILAYVQEQYADQHWRPAAISYWIGRVRKRRNSQRFDELRGMRKAELEARLAAASKKIEEAERKAAHAAMPEVREYHKKQAARLANYQSLLVWERSERDGKEQERIEQHGYSLVEQRDMLEVVERADTSGLIARLYARKVR